MGNHQTGQEHHERGKPQDRLERFQAYPRRATEHPWRTHKDGNGYVPRAPTSLDKCIATHTYPGGGHPGGFAYARADPAAATSLGRGGISKPRFTQ